MNSLLDEVDGFDYSDESNSSSLLGANFGTDHFYPTAATTTSSTTSSSSSTTTHPTFPAMTIPTTATTATTLPMGVVLDDALFCGPTVPAASSSTAFDWASQAAPTATPAGIPSFLPGLGMDAGLASAALPPMPAMPATILSNEEIESKIIHDSQAAESGKEGGEKDKEGEGSAEGEGEAQKGQNQEQEQEQPQQRVKLAELARANVGTNFGMPPFASFVRDVKSERCLKEKKRYMTRADISELVETHYKMLNSWTPYAEDFYRLNYFHMKRLAPKNLISYCFQHKPLYDSRNKFIPRQVYGACFRFGRIPPSTIQKPKQAIQLMEREDYSYFEIDYMGQLQLDDMGKLKLGIENAHYWLLDILDYDRLARYYNPNAKLVGRPILSEYLSGRNAAAKSLYEYFIRNQEQDSRFAPSLLGLPKGAAFFARVLRISQVGDLTPFALAGLCAIAAFRARTRGVPEAALSYEDAALRRAYEQILHYVALRAKALEVSQVTDIFMELAQLPEPAWRDILADAGTRAAVTALVQRGIALGLNHFEESAVAEALGIDQTSESAVAKTYWSQCISIIVGIFTNIFMQRLQSIAPSEFGTAAEEEEEEEDSEAGSDGSDGNAGDEKKKKKKEDAEPFDAEVLDLFGMLLETEVPQFQKEYLAQLVEPFVEYGVFDIKEEKRESAEKAILKKLGCGDEEALAAQAQVQQSVFDEGSFPELGAPAVDMGQFQDFGQNALGIDGNVGAIPQDLTSMFPNLQNFQI